MEQDPEGVGAKPKFLSGVNGVIAGITGLVIALGGLATAYKTMTSDKPPAQQASTEQAAVSRPAASAKEQPADRPTLYKGDLYADGAFNGGSMRLEQVGEKWVLAEGENKYEYDEIASRDKSQIVAFSADYGSTLRWPVKGGVVEESDKDRRDAWKNYAKVDPLAPAPAD
jgi:hypothetical protein